jgi:hypothetical protein
MAVSSTRLATLEARRVSLQAIYDSYVNGVEEYTSPAGTRIKRMPFEVCARELKSIESQLEQLNATGGGRILFQRSTV